MISVYDKEQIMKDVSFLTSTRFVHRGLHDNKTIPENSLIAFKNAVDHGYGIEFDVYLTDDNNLIIHHDKCIKRTTGIDTTTYKIDTSHLENYKLYGTEHSIPLLRDMLKLVDGQVPLILEIKTTHKIKATCTAIFDMISKYNGPICVESFDFRIVNWWLKHHPEFVIGQLYGDSKIVNSYLRSTRQYKRVDFVAPSCNLLITDYFKTIHDKKSDLLVVNWTVKTPDHLKNALQYADNFIFEYNGKNDSYISLDDVPPTQ